MKFSSNKGYIGTGSTHFFADNKVSSGSGPAPGATKFVILNPTDTYIGVPSIVTVQAQKADNSVDVNYQNDVTLNADGSATGDGLVTITNGQGTKSIDDAVAETVNLSLTDSEGTGLNCDSTQNLVFAQGGIDANAVLVLHNDDVGLTDSSLSGKTVNKVGNVQRSSTESVFGGFSALFDGDGDYLSIPDSTDFDLSAGGNFAIDFRIQVNDYGATFKKVFSQRTDADNGMYFYLNSDGSGQFTILNAGVVVVALNRSWGMNVDTWYHMAFIRGWGGNANDWVGCVNGVPVGAVLTDADSPLNYTGPFEIGRDSNDDNTHHFNGYIDEFRFSKGLPRWTSNFTPPASAYST